MRRSIHWFKGDFNGWKCDVVRCWFFFVWVHLAEMTRNKNRWRCQHSDYIHPAIAATVSNWDQTVAALYIILMELSFISNNSVNKKRGRVDRGVHADIMVNWLSESSWLRPPLIRWLECHLTETNRILLTNANTHHIIDSCRGRLWPERSMNGLNCQRYKEFWGQCLT